MNKRVQREITYIKKNIPSYQLYDYIYNETDEIKKIDNYNINNRYITIITPNRNKLVFTLSEYYPFKPPKELKINNIDYLYLLRNMPHRINYLYYNPNDIYFQEKSKSQYYSKPSCLCCSTLLCPDNWSPLYTIYHIINDINNHNNIKRYIMYKLILKEIFDYYNLKLDLIIPIYYYL